MDNDRLQLSTYVRTHVGRLKKSYIRYGTYYKQNFLACVSVSVCMTQLMHSKEREEENKLSEVTVVGFIVPYRTVFFTLPLGQGGLIFYNILTRETSMSF